MSYVVIVDMNQPDIRRFVGLETENQFELAEFGTLSEVRELKAAHSLGVFEWLIVGVRDNADIKVIRRR